MESRFAIGMDFGTESARVLVVDVADGRIAGQAVVAFKHGVIERGAPHFGAALRPGTALQHPQDWLDASAAACRAAMAQSATRAEQVVGVGVAFTSCTVLPALADGTPLCLTDRFRGEPMAWPKLWKHHGAAAQADRINEVARARGEPWLARYGGAVSLESFFPKILETLDESPAAYHAADVWLEAGDWLVWQLIDGPFPNCSPARLVRSTCQAGYKACWDREAGYPSTDFFAALHPSLAGVVAEKLPGRLLGAGGRAGALSASAAELFGLREGTPVSAAMIDAHAGVVGAGAAAPGTMVLVLGTSGCHMVNAPAEHAIPGVAGVVRDGILPGYFGYETGQAAVGDALEWVSRSFGLGHEELSHKAVALPPGSGGLVAVDWFNGCRTPLTDPRLSGAIVGLTLGTKPEQIYRAVIEGTAFGLRTIVATLREAGVAIDRFIAAGGLAYKSPLLMQIFADVLGEDIALASTEQSVALGAAVIGALAGGGPYATFEEAIVAMAPVRQDLRYSSDPARRPRYDGLYDIYRRLTASAGALANAMRELAGLR